MGVADEFRKKLGGESLEDAIARRESSWEQMVTRRVTSFFSLPLKPLLDFQARQAAGRGVLTLAALDDCYPTFPLRLFARRIPYARKAFLDEAFDVKVTKNGIVDRFFRGRIWTAYSGCQDLAAGETRPVVMVFPHPDHRFLAAHDSVGTVDHPGTRIVKTHKAGRVIIEPFLQMLLGSDWDPATVIS